MTKYLVLIICLLSSGAHAVTCPPADVCVTNGTITVGVNTDSDYVGSGITDFAALNSDGINRLVRAADLELGWDDVLNIWGYANPAFLNTSSPGYGSVDNTYWNINDESNSSWIGGGTPAPLVTVTTGTNTIYVKSISMDWSYAGGDVTAWANQQGYLEKWITLSGSTFRTQFRYTYLDSFNHGYCQTTNPNILNYCGDPLDNSAQYGENIAGCDGVWMQGIYLNSAPTYNQYVTYSGSLPWTNGSLISPITPGVAAGHIASENWAALLNSGGSGIGMYSPQSDISSAASPKCAAATIADPLQGGQGGPGSSVIQSATGTGGMAILFNNFNFTPGAVWNLDVYYALGSISDIRSAFYALPRYTYSYTSPYGPPTYLPVSAMNFIPLSRSSGIPLTRTSGIPAVR